VRWHVGDYWREIEGENTFFCCSICADAFENMVKRVKEEMGWKKIDSVSIKGNYSRGRDCVATGEIRGSITSSDTRMG